MTTLSLAASGSAEVARADAPSGLRGGSAIAPVIVHERAFLGAILHFRHELAHNYELKSEDFLLPSHRLIWSGLLEKHGAGASTSFQSIRVTAEANNTLAGMGGLDYLYANLLTSAGPDTDLAFEAGKILDASKIRAIRTAALDVVARIDEGAYANALEAGMESEARMFDATQVLCRGNFSSFSDYSGTYRENYRRRVDAGGRPMGISLGIGSVDALARGLKPGTFNALLAQSGMGKTGFVTSCLRHFAQNGTECAVFSLEMSKDEVLHRVISTESGVLLEHVARGNPHYKGAVEASIDRLGDFETIHVSDEPSMSLEQVSFECRRLIAERERLDIIVIDHVHLMEREEGYESYQKLMRGLKRMARKLNIVVLGLFQLNSDNKNRKDKRPLLSDLKYGGVEHCDIVMAIYRDEIYNPETVDTGVAEVIFRKVRDGSTGTARTQYIAERTEFRTIGDNKDATNAIILPWLMDGIIAAKRAADAEKLNDSSSSHQLDERPNECEVYGENAIDEAQIVWDDEAVTAPESEPEPTHSLPIAQPRSLEHVLFPDDSNTDDDDTNCDNPF